MYKCKYFSIKELVPKELLSYNENLLWLLFDTRLLKFIDLLRELYGPIIINSKSLNECGYRLSTTSTGASFSQHKHGRAADLHILSIEKLNISKEEKVAKYNEIRAELLKDERFNELNFENNIYWLHIDVGNRINRLFNP